MMSFAGLILTQILKLNKGANILRTEFSNYFQDSMSQCQLCAYTWYVSV